MQSPNSPQICYPLSNNAGLQLSLLSVVGTTVWCRSVQWAAAPLISGREVSRGTTQSPPVAQKNAFFQKHEELQANPDGWNL